MTDTSTEDKEEHKESPPKEHEHVHSYATKAELEEHIRKLEAHKQELRDELAELHNADKAEREEIKQQLAEATAFIAELKEAEKKRDEVKESKSTMVLPPDNIPPRQPNVEAEQHAREAASGEQPRKRSFLKDLY